MKRVVVEIFNNKLMKTQFKITGLYYEELGFKFRKYLDIKKIDTNLIIPYLQHYSIPLHSKNLS